VQPAYRPHNVDWCLEDAAAAARYFVGRHRDLGVEDPTGVYYMGHSAGGHLALMCALAANLNAPPCLGAVGLAAAATRVDASTAAESFGRFLFGVWGDPGTWRGKCPAGHVRDGRRPRIRLFHGARDDQVPQAQVRGFEQEARAAGLDVWVRLSPAWDHFSAADVTNPEIGGPIRELVGA
jgi:acetyl esterase/lipase